MSKQNQLDLIFQNDVAYADSRVIAKYFGKKVVHVNRDIKIMIEKISSPKIGTSYNIKTYKNANNVTATYYELNFDLTLTLVTGYDVNLRYQLIKDWERKTFSRNDIRSKGKDERKIFTDVLQAHGITGWQFGAITNNMKDSLNISRDTKRKDMDFEQLKKTRAAEALADVMLGEEEGYKEVNPVCVEAADTVERLAHKRLA